MTRILIYLILQTICSTHMIGQVNIDTLRYEKEDEFKSWTVGNTIIHSPSTRKLKFHIETGHNLIYRKDGSLYLKGTYSSKDDSLFIKNGVFEYFYENAQLRDSGAYENNIRTGIWRHFDKNGVLIYEQNFNTLIRTYFYPNKDTLAFGPMKFQQENINYEFFNLTEHEGYWVFRETNGNCDCKGKLVSSLKHGKWLYYAYGKNKLTQTKKRYSGYMANYNYDFLDLCRWK